MCLDADEIGGNTVFKGRYQEFMRQNTLTSRSLCAEIKDKEKPRQAKQYLNLTAEQAICFLYY